MKEKYVVTGMTCSACVSRVEKAVKGVAGVTECAVNLLTGDLTVEGDAQRSAVETAVKSAGYGIAGGIAGGINTTSKKDNLVKRLLLSAVLLVLCMYLSMGFPLPTALKENTLSGILQAILAISVLVIHRRFFVNGAKAVLHKSPTMDTLVSLGSGVSYLWSLYVLFSGTTAPYYFSASAMVPVVVTLGKLLEGRAKKSTTSAIDGLTKLLPSVAVKMVDGKEQTVAVSDLHMGDKFVLKAGNGIPTDAIVLQGSGTVNRSALTGESLPEEVKEGTEVSAGTVFLSGYALCRVTKIGEDTLLSRVIETVKNANSTKAPIARVADKVAGVFVPIVLGISLVTLGVHLAIGEALSVALPYAIGVLVVSCPCAMGLATPVAVMVGSGLGAKNGILYTTAEAMETAGKITAVVFDKTGTLTTGKLSLSDILAVSGSEEDLLLSAVSVEQYSSHPLAVACVEGGKNRGVVPTNCADFENRDGVGVFGAVGGHAIAIERITEENTPATALQNQGKIVVQVKDNGTLLGYLAFSDTVREESKKLSEQAKKLGVKLILLTGDNEKTANEVGKELGISRIFAGVLPTEKEAVIRQLQQEGEKVAMVGDGINDAPALVRADLGIAMGGGTDIAIQSADAILLQDNPMSALKCLAIGHATLNNIYENLGWAFCYNLVGIPLSAGVFASLGWELSPMLCSVAMSISSCLVVGNALRLNLIFQERKTKKMTKTIMITGMMCAHCEATVKKALEALPSVVSAEVSHEKGTAVLTLSEDVANDLLKATVEAKDFTVTDIR